MLQGALYPSAHSNAEGLVVLLHGYGADAEDLIGLAPYLAPHMPGVAFAAPNAPDRAFGTPGYQWFSLDEYDPDRLRRDPAQAAALYARMTQAAEKAAPKIHDYLDHLLEVHGLDDSRLMLGGFSQGAMMALHVGLRRKHKPAGILGMSGAFLGADALTHKPPVMLIHGDADMIVPHQAMTSAVERLTAASVPTEWHLVPGLGHGIDGAALAHGLTFIKACLG